jgi:hypothetical protein
MSNPPPATSARSWAAPEHRDEAIKRIENSCKREDRDRENEDV